MAAAAAAAAAKGGARSRGVPACSENNRTTSGVSSPKHGSPSGLSPTTHFFEVGTQQTFFQKVDRCESVSHQSRQTDSRLKTENCDSTRVVSYSSSSS